MRNPNTAHILRVAEEYASLLRQAVPNCVVELGGSLRSNTLLVGHQDIDLKVLVPAGDEEEEVAVRNASEMIRGIVPFMWVRKYGSQQEGTLAFAVLHRLSIEDPIAGEIEVEVLVVPARVYVGYAKYQSQLSQWMLDGYVAAKWSALQSGDKKAYNLVKKEFYAMTRALHRAGYFKEED